MINILQPVFSFCSLFFFCRLCYNKNKQKFVIRKEASTMKINLQVNADFDLDGNIHPKAIVWEDGRVFEIDRVLDVRRAASLKAGGLGIRYICRIRGKEVRLFNDEGHWFMEK
jgi:hypothetical protein